MRETGREIGGRLLALGVLLVAAFVLFKLVLGAVAFVAWLVVGVLAIAAVLWALNRVL
jgi:type IV secretory pathway TrbL component